MQVNTANMGNIQISICENTLTEIRKSYLNLFKLDLIGHEICAAKQHFTHHGHFLKVSTDCKTAVEGIFLANQMQSVFHFFQMWLVSQTSLVYKILHEANVANKHLKSIVTQIAQTIKKTQNLLKLQPGLY